GIGRYGFDILSVFKSVTWFSAFDAPVSIAREKLAGSIVVHQTVKRFSDLPEYTKLAIIIHVDTIIGASNVNGRIKSM
ncbi:MAG: hypothetical protein JSW62_05190, partial [Thermoplasmatales archaeon]